MSRRNQLLTLVVALLALGITAIAALPNDISSFEEYLFRAVNDLPDWIETPGWSVMQLGSIAAVPIVAALCIALFRDWRVPGRIALAGTSAWVLAKVVKELIDRGRPATFFSDIHLRPIWDGRGFPSGHAAVAFAIAVILSSALGRRWRIVVWGVAITAGLLRIYTAAHFPLDIIGGWGLGIAIGLTIQLIADRRSDRAVPHSFAEA